MGLFNWFSNKSAPSGKASNTHAGAASVPIWNTPPMAGPTGDGNDLRMTRVEKREQLYGVVREVMARAGMISSSYKFKVLSLDSLGQTYLVMVDVGAQYMEDAERLRKMEEQLAQLSRERHQLQIQAVYWRTNDHVFQTRPVQTSNVQRVNQMLQEQARPVVDDRAFAETTILARPEDLSDYGRLDDGLATHGGRDTSAAQVSQPRPNSRQAQPTPSGFADTEIDDRYVSPLSATQYGDLM